MGLNEVVPLTGTHRHVMDICSSLRYSVIDQRGQMMGTFSLLKGQESCQDGVCYPLSFCPEINVQSGTYAASDLGGDWSK